ncbi:MAG: hypothetical protein Ta2B_21670 [Termitinemataceae bacterium]|nr:MAG: hypothetical protein Ta2B_21670 [Termitinemataceae bacterium]
MRKNIFKFVIVLFVFFVALSGLVAEDKFGIVSGTDLSKLFAEISDSKGNIKGAKIVSLSKWDKPLSDKWVRVGGEAHILIDAPLAIVKQVLLDVDGQPSIFTNKSRGSLQRTKSAVVKKTAGNVTTITFTTESKLGPVQDESYYTADVTQNASGKDNPEKSYSETVVQTDSATNPKVRNVNAVWYAEAVTVNGKSYTYLRFADTTELNQQGLMATAVNLGLSGAHTIPLEQVMDAALARVKK